MSIENILIISLIQGITEFLPVSSSGHIALATSFFGWPQQGVIIDTAAHLGTMGAVLVYFRADVRDLFQGAWDILRGRKTASSLFLLHLVVASLPIVLCGLFFDHFVGDSLKTLSLFSWMSILFGIVLGIADWRGSQIRDFKEIGWKQALIFGGAQVLALINGVSRSGICITAGRLMGFKRIDTARFAFLMSIPTIMAATTLKSFHLFQSGDFSMIEDACLTAFFSFVVGLLAIGLLMRWLLRHTLIPFVIYRIFLGAILLLLFC